MVKAADWHVPISIFSAPMINPVNLVASLAKHFGIPLTILRMDPVINAAQTVEKLENADTRDLISGQLLDIANTRYE